MDNTAEARYPLKTWHLAVAVILVVAHMVLVWVTRVPSVTIGNDDALYLLLSRSIQSLHYLNEHIVGTPPHGQYPPGYPAFLALWTGLFGDGLDTVLAVGMLMSAIALVFTFDLARRMLGVGVALAILAALAVNPSLIQYGGQVASETPFMLLLVLTFWVAKVLPDGKRRLMALGALAITAAMTRSIGTCLVLALGLMWLLERRWKALAVYGITVILTVGAWLLWTAVAPGRIVARSYAATVVETTNQGSGNWLQSLWDRGVIAVEVYGAHSVPSSISVPTMGGTPADNLFWGAVISVTLVAGLVAFRKRLRLLPTFLILYAALLWIWPYKLTRFVVPLVPLLLLSMSGGILFLGRRWPRGATVVASVLPLALAAAAIGPDITRAEEAMGCPREIARTSPACFDDGARNFMALAELAKETTSVDAAFLTPKEATFAWFSGRKVYHPGLAVRRDSVGVPETLRKLGIDYVVLTSVHLSDVFLEVVRDLEPHCGEIVIAGHVGNAWLLHLPPEGEEIPPGRSSCAALAGYMQPLPQRDLAPPLLN